MTGGLSGEAGGAAQQLDFGGDCCHEPEDLVHSGALVIWGKNIPVTRPHWMPFINQARKKGAIMAVIDPVYSEMARKADRFFQIRPGSDGMLAIGVSRLLLERNAVDADFIAKHTNGFEAYRRLVFGHPLEDIARATDLKPEQIKEIADLYATKKPLATLTGIGPAYWTNGGAMIRLVDALAAISGNIGISGGGVSADIQGGSVGLNLSMLRARLRGESRRILLPRLGEEILGARDPAIKMGWIAGVNPASSAPDTHRVKEGLLSLEFVVAVEQFMTATAELAHVVLPCTTYLEMDDLVTAYGHNWIGLTNKVVPPQGEAKSDGEIFQLLAQRLGFGPALAGEPRMWIQRMLENLAAEGVTLERLKERSYRNPKVAAIPFADRRFGTPSGKFEFVTDFSPRPNFTDGSFHLVATKTRRMINSQILPEDLPEEPVVRINPTVLSERGFAEGDRAWIVSKVGKVKARLTADEKVRRDVVLFNPALWQGDPCGVNQLREAFLTDLGNSAAMHQTKVTLRAG